MDQVIFNVLARVNAGEWMSFQAVQRLRTGISRLRAACMLLLLVAVPAFLPAQDAVLAPAVTNSVHLSATGAEAAKGACHIELSKVNGNFIQNGGSCVLASYAIVANYFTGRAINDYFEGYCKHFGLTYTNAADAERKYADHFDTEWRKRDCRGYEVILDVHEHSKEPCFVEARKKFDARFYLDSASHVKELETALSEKQSFLNITYEPGFGYHSITVFNDGSGLRTRDTNRKGFSSLTELARIGKLRDSVLYSARP